MSKKQKLQKTTPNDKISLEIQNFSIEQSDNPDLLKFSAIACYLDTPTDGTPCGGLMDYKTVICGDADVKSLEGMGVNCSWGDGWFNDGSDNLKNHDPWFKIGVINSATQDGNAIMVDGHIWKCDFPDICDTIECAKESLGCSVEVYFDGIRRDDNEKILYGQKAHFTGMAILYKTKAAFQNTKFMCSLQGQKEETMTDELKQELANMIGQTVDDKLKSFDEKFQALEEKVSKKEETPVEQQLKADEKTEPKADESNKQDFSEMKQVIVDAIKEGFKANAPAVPEPTRKTQVEFANGDPKGTVAPVVTDNTLEQKCSEVDNDKTLTAEQRWGKKMDLWLNRENEKAL